MRSVRTSVRADLFYAACARLWGRRSALARAVPVPPGDLRYSALTRRSDIPHYRIENSAPAKCCVWPVLAPARAWVRAGAGRRGWDSECGIRNWGAGMRVFGDSGGTFGARITCPCGSVAAFDTRFTLSVWVCRSVCLGSRLLFDAQRQTGRLAICSVPVPQVEIAIRAFSRCRRGYQAWLVHFGIVRLFAAISTGCRGRGNGAGGAGFVRFLRGHIGAVSLSAGSTLGLNVEAALRPLFGG